MLTLDELKATPASVRRYIAELQTRIAPLEIEVAALRRQNETLRARECNPALCALAGEKVSPPTVAPRSKKKLCTVCHDAEIKARGICLSCYQRSRYEQRHPGAKRYTRRSA